MADDQTKSNEQSKTEEQSKPDKTAKKAKPSTRPSVTSPLYAALRQGTKELAQILPAFPDSVRPVEEPGTLGNPTQAMLTQDIVMVHGKKASLDQYSSRGGDQKNKENEKGMDR